MRRKVEHAIYDFLDASLAVVILLASIPLFALTALAVWLDSPGPVFYTQERYGKNKRIFKIYKFRTMRQYAEQSLPVWGMEADPRATRVGMLLRVTHIDEVPQLFNVLLRDMNFVGPRPERPYFADKFQEIVPGYQQRYAVRPGITGWSQVNGLRGESSIFERTEYDRYYIVHRSWLLNMRILLVTLFAKPIKHCVHPEVEKGYALTLPQALEALPGKIPLIVPIKNA